METFAAVSIGVPVTLIEALAPGGEGVPWLGRIGLAITAACHLGGSLITGVSTWTEEHFYPSATQLTFAAVTIAGLIGAALARPGHRAPGRVHREPISAPSPVRVGSATALITGGHLLVPPNWAGVLLGLFLIGLLVRLITRWSRAANWNVRHRLALAGGALFTASWGALFVGRFTGQTDALTQLGPVLFALLIGAVLVWSERRTRERRCLP